MSASKERDELSIKIMFLNMIVSCLLLCLEILCVTMLPGPVRERDAVSQI